MPTKTSKKKPSNSKAKISTIDLLAVGSQISTTASVAISVFFGAIIGVFLIWFASVPAYQGEGDSNNGVSMEKTFVSSKQGYSFNYPISWKLDEFLVQNGDNVVDSVVIKNGENKIVIYTTSVVSETTLIPAPAINITIGNISALQYRDYDPETGDALNRVVVKRPDGLFNELRGYGLVFDRVVESFAFSG